MNEDIKQIQVNIKEAEERVALGECLKRLSKNRDFKKLIEQRYFKDESHRLVMVKSSPACQTPEIQAEILRDLDGIGSLYQFFNAIGSEAKHMAYNIEQDKRMIEELENMDEDDV